MQSKTIKKSNPLNYCFLIYFFSFFFFINSPALQASPTKCVQIFYLHNLDLANPSKKFPNLLNAIYLKNLLGHFPNIESHILPIEEYKSGQIEQCFTSFYLGTKSTSTIPQTFYQDFINTKKNVVWINYGIESFNQPLQNIWGVKYQGVSELDPAHLDSHGEPGFYKYFDYKGEVFEKTFQKILNSDDYKVPDKIIVLTLANKDAEKYVVSWARHSSLSNKTPYILRNKNHWYVADNPFIFSSNQDRYMIFADVLFDMVDEKPLYPNKKPALIRVEDVNIGYTTPKQLTQLVNLFRRLKMKFSIALIPIFYDPLMTITKNPGELEKTINDSQSFLNALKFAEQNGASFIWHGVTHQYNNKKNPFNGMSGADFEFWDATKHTPIEEDSPTYVINRLQRGADVLSAANIKPSAWMPSHYLASPLDCILFGQLFYWNVGKVTYFVYQATDLQKLPQNLTFNESWPGNSASRLQYLSKLTITSDTSNLGPQMFPYEIYQDYYGQRVIPEDVGNLQPFLNNQVVQVEDIDDMIKIIRRNRVLRDVWASYFIHPFLLNSRNQGGIARYPGDVEDIQKLVVETQNAGYEFIDLKEWVKQHSPH